ncbi:DapH/DapD/GlmU-related protein [Enterococcus sp. LJL90]
MTSANILEKLQGKEILAGSEIFKDIHVLKAQNERRIADLNTGFHSKAEIHKALETITGKPIEESVEVQLPFYSDFGRHIQFGKNIFINLNVTFVDLGGITVEDQVLIGPGARLITVNHLTDPKKRRGVKVAPILLKKNVWIGANATVLPGITIGENSIVAADATVTKDVPDNVIVAGSPAKIVKTILED